MKTNTGKAVGLSFGEKDDDMSGLLKHFPHKDCEGEKQKQKRKGKRQL